MTKKQERRIWVIRPGRNSGAVRNRETEAMFRAKSVVALDDEHPIGDVRELVTLDDVREQLRRTSPELHRSAIGNIASDFIRFSRVMRIGDLLVCPSRLSRIFRLGFVIGDYEFLNMSSMPHVRQTRWVGEIAKDSVSVSAYRELGAARLFFECTKNRAEIFQHLRSLGEK